MKRREFVNISIFLILCGFILFGIYQMILWREIYVKQLLCTICLVIVISGYFIQPKTGILILGSVLFLCTVNVVSFTDILMFRSTMSFNDHTIKISFDLFGLILLIIFILFNKETLRNFF
jgi:hypothetical protein